MNRRTTLSRSRLTASLMATCLVLMSCAGEAGPDPAAEPAPPSGTMEELRMRMVEQQIAARGIRNEAVLEAFRTVPRHLFVPSHVQPFAYDDGAQPIGFGQTISQPYIVAWMTEALDLQPSDRVLEIGTGSGYQAAILARLVSEVYSIEVVEPLAERAAATLESLGYDNIHLRCGDGHHGWPEAAPFNAILVACSPTDVPQALVEQLAEGGRLAIPVGRAGDVQSLRLLEKPASGKSGGQALIEHKQLPVRFVPMVHRRG